MQEIDAVEPYNNVRRFLGLMKIHMQHFAATEARINRLTAQSFTPFDYILFDENMSSRILCDLLSPTGKHGQGDTFLQSFLGRFTQLHYGGGHCHARCEYSTRYGRRIDIALHWKDSMLAIENKLWAEDQKLQLADYLEEISQFDNYYLLYLTHHGGRPGEYTLPSSTQEQYANRYDCISWRQVVDWLASMIKDVEAEKLRYFLKDFCRQIRATLRYGDA